MNAVTQTAERIATPLRPPAPNGGVPALVAPMPPREEGATEPKRFPVKMARAIVAITREIGAVEKNGWNSFHQYKYQKWDDILDRVSVLLANHGLIITPSEVSRSLVENEQQKNDQLVGITYEFIIVNEDGDEWPVRPRMTAFGRVRDSKNVCDDKAAAKCHTQAEKYFLIHFFKIRTSDVIDSDADGSQVEQRVEPAKVAAPKPPKPGSAEAQAMDDPRTIPGNGHTATSWTDAFIAAIERDPKNAQKWHELNRNNIDKLEKYPAEAERVIKSMAKTRTIYAEPPDAAAGNPPKPPHPTQSPAVAPMPDAAADGHGFIKWLTDKLASFATYEAGEKYWNDTIEALDLPGEVQEDAMGCWRRFEERFSE